MKPFVLTFQHNITPLHVAAKWGKVNMVSLLLDKGSNLESKTRDGLTPLHCAARSGHENVVDMMVQRGAPISAKTKNGLAPLHMASQGDHVDAARILLHHKVCVAPHWIYCFIFGQRQLHFAAKFTSHNHIRLFFVRTVFVQNGKWSPHLELTPTLLRQMPRDVTNIAED